jgi:hypothetical protein
MHSFPVALKTLCLSALFLELVSTQASDDFDSATVLSLGQCHHVTARSDYNATGSTKQPGFFTSDEWTWHVGLRSNGSTAVTEDFWVDTTGSINLNSPDVPYRVCAAFYYRMDGLSFEDSQKDNGNCEQALGLECLRAMRSSVQISENGDSCVPPEYDLLRCPSTTGMGQTSVGKKASVPRPLPLGFLLAMCLAHRR